MIDTSGAVTVTSVEAVIVPNVAVIVLVPELNALTMPALMRSHAQSGGNLCTLSTRPAGPDSCRFLEWC